MVKSVISSRAFISFSYPILHAILFPHKSIAVANLSDGETPAKEDVCDGHSGNVYGLRNAYCEAMHCDEGPVVSRQACDKVKANFVKHTGIASLPCDSASDIFVMKNLLR